MDVISIALILLILAVGIGTAFYRLYAARLLTGWKRWLAISASLLLMLGMAGFLGAALSASGGLNWLPPSFEWPVGLANGIVSTKDNRLVVPHVSSGRVQVYDQDWTFLRSWNVDARGGAFKLNISDDNLVHVITARGNWHYVYDPNGTLLSKESYSPVSYSSFPDEGTTCYVPTPWWLWMFSSPIWSWLVVAVGMVFMVWLDRSKAGGKTRG
jgi:YD repeat-containing protein